MFKKICYEIHLYLGIISGLILIAVCLSGALLVFREDFKAMLYPSSYRVAVPANASPLPIEDLLAKIETQYEGKKITSLSIPKSKTKPVTVMLASGSERGQRGGRPEGGERSERGQRNGQRPDGQQRGGHRQRGEVILINPYTGEALEKADTQVFDKFFMSMTMLHRNLYINIPIPALGERASVGKYIVGIATLIYVVISLTGLALWFPKFALWKNWKVWKIGLQIRFRRGFWRCVYDLHNTVGFYTLIPMLILALTGLCWSFSWYREGASELLGDQIFKQRMQRPAQIEEVDSSAKPLPLARILELQDRLFPADGDRTISIPSDRTSAAVISQGHTGFFALNVQDKTQWDMFRGVVVPVEHFGKTVEVERFADKPFGAKIASLVRTLHFGDVTGTSSKIVFFIACLLATSFPVTGVMLWIKKLVAKRKTKTPRSDCSPRNAELDMQSATDAIR
jgi:uncharacterized iron-regulated membrane protein